MIPIRCSRSAAPDPLIPGAIAGEVLPFALGSAGLDVLFAVPLLASIFSGAAMTATSIGITANVPW
ncbi:MAG: hypothetical protein QUV07_09960 [Cyanobium sp. CZS 25K]|nr:hypothetical protein [Cyanobium sp. CZS25K]